jgi:hypothetical protein
MRSKVAAAIATLSLALLAVPTMAGADHHCSTSIVIFSSPSGLNSQAALCLLVEQETQEVGFDPRLINPGSTGISVRYTVDLGASVPTLTAVLNGLGFEDQEITLTRAEILAGLYAYDSAVIELPAGAASSGCVTASIELVLDANSFHTIDAGCP